MSLVLPLRNCSGWLMDDLLRIHLLFLPLGIFQKIL